MTNVKINSLDWDIGGLPEAPTAPETLPQTGLMLGFLNDLILRALYTRGGMLGLELAKLLCLPFKVVEESLNFLKNEKCIEVLGGDLIGRISYRFTLTELGRTRAKQAMEMCAYVGPAGAAPLLAESTSRWSWRKLLAGLNSRTRIIQFCVVVMCLALFILMRK